MVRSAASRVVRSALLSIWCEECLSSCALSAILRLCCSTLAACLAGVSICFGFVAGYAIARQRLAVRRSSVAALVVAPPEVFFGHGLSAARHWFTRQPRYNAWAGVRAPGALIWPK